VDFIWSIVDGGPPCQGGDKAEVENLLAELVKIGRNEDFLSEHPGSGYNVQCRHVRTIFIGRRLNDIGGIELMAWVHKKIKRKLKGQLASHLEYAWDGVGNWKA
jgi:hypothetical protein